VDAAGEVAGTAAGGWVAGMLSERSGFLGGTAEPGTGQCCRGIAVVLLADFWVRREQRRSCTSLPAEAYSLRQEASWVALNMSDFEVHPDLPPRPNRDTGLPRPPHAPRFTGKQGKSDRDPDRDTRVSSRPEPPPGKAQCSLGIEAVARSAAVRRLSESS